MSENFLPVSRKDLEKRGWKELDIILISGDGYVDHHSYGPAVIGRVLEKKGYKVGIIAQPDWRNTKDFLVLGRPRLFFGISAGNVDSMVANYTANKRNRRTDYYSPGGKAGLRPDRAVIVYANKAREAFGNIPIVLGGLEASLRRLAHYDYWDNNVRRSILVDSKGDILVYGMGETQVIEIARYLKDGRDIKFIDNINGTVVVRRDPGFLKKYEILPSFEEVREDKTKFNEAFKTAYFQQNPYKAKVIVQKHADRFVIQFPPALPLRMKELDQIYELPYARRYHPSYERYGGIKSFETVKFSITSHRGCCGECSFCSLFFHQGRIVQSRSSHSIVEEVKLLSERKEFRGTITDVGGPTANLYRADCFLWKKEGFCETKKCLVPSKCGNLKEGYEEAINTYRKIRKLPGVKHVFIGSGFRYDLLIDNYADKYLEEVCEFHISGQMKVAPEHIAVNVLKHMNKPNANVYEKFVRKFTKINKKIRKRLYLVNYFISSHPGATLKDELKLALYFLQRRMHPEQIQDFIPLPMSLSGCMYYTGSNPFTGENLYIPKTFRERKQRRALLQSRNPQNKKLILETLKGLKLSSLAKKFFER